MKIKFCVFLWLVSIAISACSPTSKTLTINNVWARPAQAGENGAIYFIIENDTNIDDALISANTEVASSAEAHMSMVNNQDVMTMQMQEAVKIPSGEKIVFEPRGLHIMLVNLNRNLKIGDTFTLTLNFEKAGEITIQVEVKEQP